MRPLTPCSVLFAAAVAFFGGCTGPSTPPPGVTLLVTNATCTADECTPLSIHGFVPKFTVPGQPPWGFLDIGLAHSASTCLTLPSSHTLTVTGPDGATDITWTLADPMILTAVDPDRAILLTPAEFVPEEAEGWAVTFGGSSPAQPVASSSCVR